MEMKKISSDKVFEGIASLIVLAWCVICIYPLWLVVVYSISDPALVNACEIWLIPKGIRFDGYKQVFARPDILKGYWNTIIQTVGGTAINMLLTIPAAYSLSKKRLFGGSFIMKMMVFTMYFSGGLIPSFLNVRNLGLLNTYWAIVLIGGVSVTNLIIARTFFMSLPEELEEAARIDGCGSLGIFLKIVLPLSKAMLGVIMLYYVVGHWNNYSSALYYTPQNTDHWPLQMVLRNYINNLKEADIMGAEEEAMRLSDLFNQIKYSSVVVSSLPVLILYPFVQKYFEKGVMIGSVKG